MGGGGCGASDELRLLREQVAELAAQIDALPQPDVTGGRAMACKTISGGSYPGSGAVGTTFYVQAQDVAGAASEGGGASVSAKSGKFFAVNLLAGLPAAGTEIKVYFTARGPVFSYG